MNAPTPRTGRLRRFLDAHPSVRCQWTITLRDKSTAQCGRSTRSGHTYCAQHERMDDAGKAAKVTP